MKEDIRHPHNSDPSLPPLPDTLWPKLVDAHRRRRRVLRGGVEMLCAALILGGIALVAPDHDDRVQPSAQTYAQTHATPASWQELRAVDHALQAAYALGASDDEIEPLWQLRRTLAMQASPEQSTL